MTDPAPVRVPERIRTPAPQFYTPNPTRFTIFGSLIPAARRSTAFFRSQITIGRPSAFPFRSAFGCAATAGPWGSTAPCRIPCVEPHF